MGRAEMRPSNGGTKNFRRNGGSANVGGGRALTAEELRKIRNADPTPAVRTVSPTSPSDSCAGGSAVPVKFNAGAISCCKCAMEPNKINACTLASVLKIIKKCTLADTISKIRNATNKKEQSKIKAHELLQFTTGRYAGNRDKENLQSFAGFKIWDFDRKENPKTDFAVLKRRVSRFPFCLSVFESPSGGIKALIRTDEQSDAEFRALSEPYLAVIGAKIDLMPTAMNWCFASADSEAFICAEIEHVENVPCIVPFDTLSKTMDAGTAMGLFPDLFQSAVYVAGEKFLTRKLHDNGDEVWTDTSRGSLLLDLQEFPGVNRRIAALALRKLEQVRQAQRVYNSRSHTRAGFYAAGTLLKDDVMVLSGPRRIAARAGMFPHIVTLFKTLFPDDEDSDSAENCMRFLCWMSVAAKNFDRIYESNGRVFFPTPFLALMGEAGAGKDLLYETIIRPLLGQRDPAMMTRFMLDEPWLETIAGQEIVFGSEIRGMSWHERKVFSATTKSVLGGKFLANGKNKEPFYSATAHYLIELVNIDEGGNCADSLPADTADMNDKVVCISMFNARSVKKVFPSRKRGRWDKVLQDELPAFKDWLCGGTPMKEMRLRRGFEIPEAWQDDRFGMKGWRAPEAKRAEAETGSGFEMSVHRAFLWFLKNNGKVGSLDLTREKGFSASELSVLINENRRADGFPDVPTMSPRFVGNAMAKLCDHYPRIYSKRPAGGKEHSNVYNFYAQYRDDVSGKYVALDLDEEMADYTSDSMCVTHPFASATCADL